MVDLRGFEPLTSTVRL